MIRDYEIWKNNQNLEQNLLNELNTMSDEQIQDAFSKDLSFGTAGMRGLLGCGTNRLNIYTVEKATRGLALYLLDQYKDQEIGVAIAYDSRHFSKEFCAVCAKTLATYGISTYIYDDVKPTPLLSYLVRYKQAQAGIMITASHNPKEYNGYKVYNHTGSQLNIEEANLVTKYIESIDDIFNFTYDSTKFNLINVVSDEVEQSYLDAIGSVMVNKDIDRNSIKVVFTPEHGTSSEVMPRCFKQYGYDNLICVEEQMSADGDFPNTKTSNPEDVAAFELAIEYGLKNTADILIANDPDADRLGVMYFDGNKYIPLSGNQTGTLMIDYLINHAHEDLTNKKLFKTIVTGEMGANIARAHNIEVKELLTGFKFIGEQIALMENKDDYFFGYEESYGYLIKPIVRDKDAIQSALLIAEMTAYYKQHNLTLGQRLEQLYQEYGFYEEVTYSLSYNQPSGMDIIHNAMQKAREMNINEICGYQIDNKIDYLIPQGSLPSADVVKFYLQGIGWLVLRPSGTEPKLKVYVSIKANSMEEAQKINQDVYTQIKSILDLD